MATSGQQGPSTSLTFYPEHCFSASRTHLAWVPLTAFDIHFNLRTRRGNKTKLLYFYLNHPITFVCLVGVVVSHEDFHEKRWILILDDSSGATIEVSCPKPVLKLETDQSRQVPDKAAKAEQEKVVKRLAVLASLEVGTVVQVSGTIGSVWDIRQIQLEKIAVVADTNAEIAFWDRRAELKRKVLSKPWVLSPEEQNRLRNAAQEHDKAEKAYAEKLKNWDSHQRVRERKQAERIQLDYQQEELKRAAGAEEARLAGELLMAKHLHRNREKLS